MLPSFITCFPCTKWDNLKTQPPILQSFLGVGGGRKSTQYCPIHNPGSEEKVDVVVLGAKFSSLQQRTE